MVAKKCLRIEPDHALDANCIVVGIIGMRLSREQEFANRLQKTAHSPGLCLAVIFGCSGFLLVPNPGYVLDIVLGAPLLNLSLQAEVRPESDDVFEGGSCQGILHSACKESV